MNSQFVHILVKNAYLFCSCLLLISPLSVDAQEKKDTANIYRKIEKKANEHKATRFIYNVIFENPDDAEDTTTVVVIVRKTANPFLKYKGKIVREIRIVVRDPFGYSVNDFRERKFDYFERMGNKFHATSREHVIRNILLFKPDQELDPLEFSESERLLRLSPNINDARIYVQKQKGAKRDSVDVMVVVQDRWSTIISSDYNSQGRGITFTEKNIFGLGHQFTEGFAWSPADHYIKNLGSYSIVNVKNTFISSSVFYSISKEDKQIGVSMNRPFFSPLAKWAGGASITKNYTVFAQSTAVTDIITKYVLDYNTNELWGAKSFPLSSSKSASLSRRSSNFIIGARYYHVNYSARPSFEIDSNFMNRDQTLYLSNVGFTHRRYYRDRYLYRFGANEDIPEGFSAEFVQGTLRKEWSSHWYYSGLKFAAGKYFVNFGYLSGGVSYGTFYDKSFSTMGVVNFDAFYFSDLIKNGRWLFRQFTRYKIVHGIGRESYESINIDGSQMYGFASNNVSGMHKLVCGTSKMILNLEFVIYSPYKIAGFRFAPVLSFGFATVGNQLGALFNTNVYQAFALGLLVRNEYFIINTVEISIGFYPYMPGNANYTMKANPISSYNVQARDYVISKPDLVSYQ